MRKIRKTYIKKIRQTLIFSDDKYLINVKPVLWNGLKKVITVIILLIITT